MERNAKVSSFWFLCTKSLYKDGGYAYIRILSTYFKLYLNLVTWILTAVPATKDEKKLVLSSKSFKSFWAKSIQISVLGGKISYPKIVEMASLGCYCCCLYSVESLWLKSASALESLLYAIGKFCIGQWGRMGTSFLQMLRTTLYILN